jgi:hypothetical protein
MNPKIIKLSARIDALASRRRGKLSMDKLSDAGAEKLRQLAGGKPDVKTPTGCEHMSTEALMSYLVDLGGLDPVTDFKPAKSAGKNGSAIRSWSTPTRARFKS